MKRHRADGEAKRQRIFETALSLFREKGFRETTMRHIAQAADISLGSAYHYFPSKQAIVLAFYDRNQGKHEDEVREKLPATEGLKQRLALAFHTRIDDLREDRGLLVAIARCLPDPADPLSVFSEESRPVRDRSIALFREVIDLPEVDEEKKDLLALGLWALHMLSLLLLVFDTSDDQERTHRVIDRVVGVLPSVLPIIQSPLIQPLWDELVGILHDAGVPTAL